MIDYCLWEARCLKDAGARRGAAALPPLAAAIVSVAAYAAGGFWLKPASPDAHWRRAPRQAAAGVAPISGALAFID